MTTADDDAATRAFAERLVEALTKHGPFVAYAIEYAEGRFDDLAGLHQVARRQGLELMRIARIVLSPDRPWDAQDEEMLRRAGQIALELSTSYAVMLLAESRQEVDELPLMSVGEAAQLVPADVAQWLEGQTGLTVEFLGA